MSIGVAVSVRTCILSMRSLREASSAAVVAYVFS